jgi:hypothetical protein
VTGVRWWTPAELEAAMDDLAPRRLPARIRELIANGPPAEPIDAGA